MFLALLYGATADFGASARAHAVYGLSGPMAYEGIDSEMRECLNVRVENEGVNLRETVL